MIHRVFFSYHYKPDHWRAYQVRTSGAIQGNSPVSDDEWETITIGGESVIRRWIDDQQHGKTCVVVLIGSQTAGRKWIKYEIKRGWDKGKGVVGIYVHNLKDLMGDQTPKGRNPFEDFTADDGKRFSSIVRAYDPPFTASRDVYNYIRDNIVRWVDEAVEIRKAY